MAGDLDRPCLVMVAPNGARRRHADHPALPVTAEELARDAAACAAAGATALHMHLRDEEERHSLDPDRARVWLARVRQAVGSRMAIQLTTEAVGRYTPAEQMAFVRALRPEAVSLAPRELFGDGDEPDAEVRAFLAWLVETGISPQYILYTPEEVRHFHALRARGVIPQARPFVLFVLGRYLEADQRVSPTSLCAYLAAHDPACPWAVCAFGREETACLLAAAAMGGHVRVGFENSLLNGDGSPARDNAQRVATIVEGLGLMGRRPADPGETRALLAAAAR